MSRLSLIIAVISAVLLSGTAAAADVTAVSTLERGRILSRGDFEVYPAPHEDPAQIENALIGKQLTRTVYAGYEITSRHLQEPLMVQRNTIVTMNYTIGSLTITTHGRAVGQGQLGDTIQVLNEESKKRVQAVITGPDQVSVK